MILACDCNIDAIPPMAREYVLYTSLFRVLRGTLRGRRCPLILVICNNLAFHVLIVMRPYNLTFATNSVLIMITIPICWEDFLRGSSNCPRICPATRDGGLFCHHCKAFKNCKLLTRYVLRWYARGYT